MTKEQGIQLQSGAIVQVNPDSHLTAFAECLVIVTDVKDWGIVGYVRVPERHGPVLAYIRLEWKNIESVGTAMWNDGVKVMTKILAPDDRAIVLDFNDRLNRKIVLQPMHTVQGNSAAAWIAESTDSLPLHRCIHAEVVIEVLNYMLDNQLGMDQLRQLVQLRKSRKGEVV